MYQTNIMQSYQQRQDITEHGAQRIHTPAPYARESGISHPVSGIQYPELPSQTSRLAHLAAHALVPCTLLSFSYFVQIRVLALYV